MGLDVSKLVMVAQDTNTNPGKGKDDPELRGFADTWAKQVYGCPAGCVKPFTSYADFLTKLKAYDHIGKLAILCHAGRSNLSFPAGLNTLTPKDLDEIVADLGTPVPVVDNLEFLGCVVGRDVTGLYELGKPLKVQSAIAFNWAHIFQPLNVPIDPGDTGAALRDRIGEDAYRYLVPGTDLDAAAATGAPKVQLWIEWYRVLVEDQDADSVNTPFEKDDPIEHRKNYRRRSEAHHIQVLSQTQAQDLEKDFKEETLQTHTKVEVIKPWV